MMKRGMMKIASVEEMPVYMVFFDLTVYIEKANKSFPKDFFFAENTDAPVIQVSLRKLG